VIKGPNGPGRPRVYPVDPEAQQRLAPLLEQWMDVQAPEGKPRDPISFMRDPGQMVYDIGPDLRTSSHPANWKRVYVSQELETGTAPITPITINTSMFSNRMVVMPEVHIFPMDRWINSAKARLPPSNPPITYKDLSIGVYIQQIGTTDNPDLIWGYSRLGINWRGDVIEGHNTIAQNAGAWVEGQVRGGGDIFVVQPQWGPTRLALPGPLYGQGTRPSFNVSLRATLPTPNAAGNLYSIAMSFWQRQIYTDEPVVT